MLNACGKCALCVFASAFLPIGSSTILYLFKYTIRLLNTCTAVSSEAWAKLRDWASVAGRGRLLLSGSVAHASLKTAVFGART